MANLDVNASLKEFGDNYLGKLKRNLSHFGIFFTVIFAINFIAFSILIYQIINVIKVAGIQGLIAIFPVFAIQTSIVWFAILGRSFVKLQVAKTENSIINTVKYREDNKLMSEKIYGAAEKRAGHNVSVKGENHVLVIGSGTVSDVSSTRQIEGSPDVIDTLSLLIEYCRESNNSDALREANSLAEEAAKDNPDKKLIFEMWSKIVGAIPSILNAVKIVKGVKEII